MSCPTVPFTQRAWRMYPGVHLPPGSRIQMVAQFRLTPQRLCFRQKEPDVSFCCRCWVSDSLWPHGLWPTRLLCPWDFPGKNTSGLPCPLPGWSLLTQGSNAGLLKSPLLAGRKPHVTLHLTYSCDFSQLLMTLVGVSPGVASSLNCSPSSWSQALFDTVVNFAFFFSLPFPPTFYEE